MFIALAAAALLWALWQPLPSCVRNYLRAQLIYIPPVLLTSWFLGTGPFYAIVYIIFTAWILLAALWIVYEAMYTRAYRLRGAAVAFILTLCLARLTYMGLEQSVSLYTWIVLVEGAILLWCGILLTALAAHQQDKSLALAMGFLWLAQALFDFGDCLHWGWPLWNRLNYIVPPSLIIALCVWIGLRARARLNASGRATEPI